MAQQAELCAIVGKECKYIAAKEDAFGLRSRLYSRKRCVASILASARTIWKAAWFRKIFWQVRPRWTNYLKPHTAHNRTSGLSLKAFVNGESRQDARTDDLIFDVVTIMAFDAGKDVEKGNSDHDRNTRRCCWIHETTTAAERQWYCWDWDWKQVGWETEWYLKCERTVHSCKILLSDGLRPDPMTSQKSKHQPSPSFCANPSPLFDGFMTLPASQNLHQVSGIKICHDWVSCRSFGCCNLVCGDRFRTKTERANHSVGV